MAIATSFLFISVKEVTLRTWLFASKLGLIALAKWQTSKGTFTPR